MSYQGLNAATGRPIADLEHIRQSIADILATPIGTRVMRRSYGSLLPELIDQPMHGATRLRLYAPDDIDPDDEEATTAYLRNNLRRAAEVAAESISSQNTYVNDAWREP